MWFESGTVPLARCSRRQSRRLCVCVVPQVRGAGGDDPVQAAGGGARHRRQAAARPQRRPAQGAAAVVAARPHRRGGWRARHRTSRRKFAVLWQLQFHASRH